MQHILDILKERGFLAQLSPSRKTVYKALERRAHDLLFGH